MTNAPTMVTATTAAPAFTAAQLSAPPSTDWISVGGNIQNQRYSTLNQINTANVAGLKPAWSTNLDGSGKAKKYSQEATPLVYQGVMYISTGNSDVFALDATTGAHLWTFHSNIDQKNATVCCGWDSRGLAIGGGLIYVAQLDGWLTALDQNTGNIVWKVQNVRWQDGATMTMAPSYYNGMVYVGMSGGEFGARGSETAYDAATGAFRWRFFTVPSPGDIGSGTWPSNSEWQTGGATVWNNPSIDPQTNTLIFTTSNADAWSGRGPGDNLFTSSFVAIDATTGQYRWHYQVVHHDIWDYDCPSPTVQFDVAINGVLRHGVAEACKTGWVYELDRDTGLPLTPIKEKKVPQNKFNNTAKTQPYPVGDTLVPQCAKKEHFKGDSPAGTPYKIGCIFTPYDTKTWAAFAPTAGGGNNWPPISYNPNTHAVYACETKADMSLGAIPTNLVKPYVGGDGFTNVSFGKNNNYGGTISALDVTTNRLIWQTDTSAIHRCYGGALTTAGGLLFTGRVDGSFIAQDVTNGKELWSTKLQYGADAPPMTYSVNGRQYVAIFDGGSVGADFGGKTKGVAPHGDEVSVFAVQ